MEHIFAPHSSAWWALNIAICLIGGFLIGDGVARSVRDRLRQNDGWKDVKQV